MVNQVKWSPLAEEDLSNILDYLSEKWNPHIAARFLHKLDECVLLITQNPSQYPVINHKLMVRKCVITKHNTLFYRVVDRGTEILRIYDTRRDPKKLKIM